MIHSVDQNILAQAGPGESAAARSTRPAGGWGRAVWIWAICGFLLLAVGLVFGQTLRHEFTGYDDDGFVYQNPRVTPGLTLPGLRWALTDGPFGEWYPLTALSHMLDCQLYGVKPAGHYLTNVLLHAASSVLLFLVLLRMTGALWPSAWVAAVFAIHPLHVESVAWIAERRDVLSGLFFMLTLGAYTLYTERPSLARYLGVVACFALGLMAKPMLVTVPLLLLLLDYWPLHRFFRTAAREHPKAASSSWISRLPVVWRLVVEKIPLLVLAAASCWIVFSTHSAIRATNPVERLPLVTRLANALISYAAYIGQSFYPVRLALFYPHPGNNVSMAGAAGALALLLAITAVATYFWRRLPYLLVGWLWFLGTLFPVIGLVQIGSHARADRYTYLSQIGLSIALAWSVWSFYQWRQLRQPQPWRPWTLAAVSAAAVLVLGAVAWRQTSFWRNPETLWAHTVACTENNVLARYSLGYTYAMQRRIDAAIDQLREAVAADSIDPLMIARSHGLLADCLTTQGKNDEALMHLEEAVRIVPAAPMSHARLALALVGRGRLDRAIVEWRETVRQVPTHVSARLGLADALLAHGDAAEATAQCREALQQKPDSTEAIITLAAALAAEGKADEAIPLLEQVLQVEPQNAPARFCLGQALHDRGESDSALAHLNEALRLQPDNVRMLWQMAWILATDPNSAIRNGGRAAGLARNAIRLSGGQEPRALDALAAALAEIKKFDAAIDAAEQASAVARTNGDDTLADAVEQRQRLYRQNLPYRQPATPGQRSPAEPPPPTTAQ